MIQIKHWLRNAWPADAFNPALPLRLRLFRLMCMVISLLCLCVILPANLFERGTPIMVKVIVFVAGLLSLLCFAKARKGRNYVKSFLLGIAIALNIAWFLDGGMDGSMNYYLFGAIVLPMVLLKGRLRWLYVGSLLIDFCCLNLAGYYFPKLVTPFSSHTAHILDIVTGLVSSGVSITVVVWVVIRNYDREVEDFEIIGRQLATSQEKFSKAFQSSPNGIIISEFETGRIIEVNQSFCRLCGYSAEELIGRKSIDFGAWSNEQERQQLLQLLNKNGSVRELELQKTNGRGENKVVLFSAETIELGGQRCMVCLVQDITERKRAEEVYRSTAGRLRLIAQMSAAIIGNCTAAELAQRIATRIREVFEVDACVIRVLENNELVLLGASGVPVEQLAPRLPVFGLGQMLVTSRSPVVVPDVSEHPVLKTVANPGPNGFAFTAFAGVPLVAEDTIVGILGIYVIPHPRKFSALDIEHLQIVANHAAISLANERHFKTVEDQKNQLEKVIAEREQAEARRKHVEQVLSESEQQLRQSQKLEAIGQLAGGVAHDFNNILTALLMQAELVELIDLLPKEAREGMRQIKADARRATELTKQLLLFSRRQVMQNRVLDLNDVVTNLAKMLQRVIREDIRLQIQPHHSPLLTSADAGMLDQVLMNLTVNARDAMPNGGWIQISTGALVVDENLARQHPDSAPGSYVSLCVRDTGTGIPLEVLPKIFEPFFTTKEPGKGTGLGLATVFGIVKQHQGWIKVENHPGKGVAFHIYLPACSAAHTESLPTTFLPKPVGGAECILMVEDEPVVLRVTRKLLERHGYKVLAAPDAMAALQLWEAHSVEISLLFTDLVMPGGFGGLELAQRLRKHKPSLKILFTSGYSRDLGGRDLHLQPGEDFIQKPFATRQLLETIRRNLDR